MYVQLRMDSSQMLNAPTISLYLKYHYPINTNFCDIRILKAAFCHIYLYHVSRVHLSSVN